MWAYFCVLTESRGLAQQRKPLTQPETCFSGAQGVLRDTANFPCRTTWVWAAAWKKGGTVGRRERAILPQRQSPTCLGTSWNQPWIRQLGAGPSFPCSMGRNPSGTQWNRWMLLLEATHVQRARVKEHMPVPGRALGSASSWGKHGVKWEPTTGLRPTGQEPPPRLRVRPWRAP